MGDRMDGNQRWVLEMLKDGDGMWIGLDDQTDCRDHFCFDTN